MNNTTTEHLKELTDSIKAGERVVLLPPGIFSLVAVVILLIIASVALVGSLISIFASGEAPSFKAGIQFSSMLVIFIFVIFPGLMIFQGKKSLSLWMFFYASVVLIASSFLIIINMSHFLNYNFSNTPLLFSLIFSLSSLYVMRTGSFHTLKEFFYLLKKK